jgi:lysozyme
MPKVDARGALIAGTALASMFAAMSVSIQPLFVDEGYVGETYLDIANVGTACGGVTGPEVVRGKRYTVEECKDLTARAYLKITLEIARCLPANLSADTRGAFGRTAYNIGSGGFCTSSMSRLALAGDLSGACAAISKYVYVRSIKDAFGRPKPIPGLVARRARERAQCEAGLLRS